jgi:DNA-binding MurR/RpiR family transcriptional regulator
LKLRRAIDKEGLYAFAKRSGVQPSTVQRLAHAAGKTHTKTLAKVEGALS